MSILPPDDGKPIWPQSISLSGRLTLHVGKTYWFSGQSTSLKSKITHISQRFVHFENGKACPIDSLTRGFAENYYQVKLVSDGP